MTPRLNIQAACPEAYAAMRALETYVVSSGLEKSLIELVKIRASQINGCAFCLHMHTKDARADGETEARIYLLDAWAESSFYTPRERAALGWTEALTLLTDGHAADDSYEPLKAVFTAAEIAKLTLLICTINSWNRIAVGFRFVHPV